MDIPWQQVLVVGIIAVAGWSVTRKVIRTISAFRRGGGKCIGCQSACVTDETPHVVQLSVSPRETEPRRRTESRP